MLAHDDAGSGDPVLLVHSAVADRRMWAKQIDALAPDHRLIAPDLPGFGESPLVPGPNDVTQALVDLLDALGLASVAVVASSFGGRVALGLASRHPDRVERLVLLAPALREVPDGGELDDVDAEEGRLLDAGELDAAAAFAARVWLGPDADDGARMLVATMQRRTYELQVPADAWPEPPSIVAADPDLGALGMPVTVLTGDLDFALFGRIGETIAARVPNAQHIRLPWAGHLPSLERPDEVSALLRRILT